MDSFSSLNDIKRSWPNGILLSRCCSQEVRIYFHNPSSKKVHQVIGDFDDDIEIDDIKKTSNKMMIQSKGSIALYNIKLKYDSNPSVDFNISRLLTGMGDKFVANRCWRFQLDDDMRIAEFSDDRLIGYNEAKIVLYQWVKLSSCSMYVYVFTVFKCE